MSKLSHDLRLAVKDPTMDYGDLWAYCEEAADEIEQLEQHLAAAEHLIKVQDKALTSLIDFAGTVAGGAGWWDDIWADLEKELEAARPGVG